MRNDKKGLFEQIKKAPFEKGNSSMEIKDYLEYIVKQIHTIVIATIDDDGLPVTAAIDMMDYDEDGLYFLTAKGKSFYERLVNKPYIAFTGLRGNYTLESVAVSFKGKTRELGYDKIPCLFEKNPYMYEIYPNGESRKALTVFQIYEGNGEYFDLSKKPIERATFTLNKEERKIQGYFINDQCIGCRSCLAVCPQNCIISETIPFIIEQRHCLHCGNCLNICPAEAVERR